MIAPGPHGEEPNWIIAVLFAAVMLGVFLGGSIVALLIW